MRIMALMKYSSRAASTRQRLTQFLPYLQEQGIEVEVWPLLDDEYIARIADGARQSFAAISVAYLRRLKRILSTSGFDAVWLQYEVFPFLPSPFERIVALLRIPIIYDFDDAIFHQYDAHKNPVIRALLGNKLAPLLRRASLCICGNSYIQKYSAQFCSNTLVIPTVVDTQQYKPAMAVANHGLTVGWIGSPSTWSYVEPLLPVILPCIRAAGATFKVVGGGIRSKGLLGVEAVDWAEKAEVREVQSFDIGIMPLPDEKWARGKCGYKLIQYMACGAPVIASPVGVNTDIVVDGVNGYLVKSREDWKDALNLLLTDSELRRRMGKNGRQRVIESYSFESQKQRLLAAILQLKKKN